MPRLPRPLDLPRLRDAVERRFPVLGLYLRHVDRHGAEWATERRRRAIGPRQPAPARVWLVMDEALEAPEDVRGVFATSEEAHAFTDELLAADPDRVFVLPSFDFGYRWEDRGVRYRSFD